MELFVFLQDVLDSLEFARGSADSTWGSVRAAMGHPEPFPVKYVAIGNEDCGKKFYRGKIFNYIIIASCVILCTRATQCPFTTERKISQT
jgi:alpha-L-arabinofuranosidase